MIRVDHPSNTKRGGGCVYHNQKVSVRQMISISLPESLSCKIVIGERKGNVFIFTDPHENSQHQITYAKLNLQKMYPPPY